ncbi:hypothetical protein BDM02DRAFT_3191202 [Thelephora ganbajun]|uniref:Uncharacterized protein n=1 Tax=Thelephora ganbajun TaxID=370292 RepID=A0ACB6Z2Q8_THEGA|nr:hypothetical protein BDM02DRAFT_3191202 [Thelephora ganbajun]
MTLENNCTFISPHNQRVSHIDTRPHHKNGKPTPDSYGFKYPTMASLVNAITTQEDNEFPRCQYTSGCSFDDIIWQQAIGALKNLDLSLRFPVYLAYLKIYPFSHHNKPLETGETK